MSQQLNQLDAARLRNSLSARLNTEAKRRGVTADLVRKQYIFAIFLGRIFQDDDAPWVLLGGNALLIRTGGGRFTQDIDLARETAWPAVEDARDELAHLASRPFGDNDPFAFELEAAVIHSEPDPYGYGGQTAKVKARALLGGATFETFNIDITTRRHVDGAVDQVPLRAVIDHATLEGLPSVPTTPVENHLADKLCAMYERHGPDGSSASTRYRDLADVVRIVTDIEFDAARLRVVMDREAGRRRMTLPDRMETPAPAWATEFPKAAAGFAEYPPEHHQLDAALRFAGDCLDPVLSGERTGGTWLPGHGWT